MYALLLGLLLSTASDPRSERDEELLTPRHTLDGHRALVRCLRFGPKGLLATGGKDRLVCLWDVDGELVERIDLRPGGG